MIGATDVESAGHAQSSVEPAKLQEAFAKSYPTPDAGAKVLEAYRIVDGSNQCALRAALERFHSDAVFDLGIYRARALLTAQRRANHGDVTSIQPYHREFGNPFPGIKRGCAHHGIEMIYRFDVFHDALADADNGIFNPYPEPSAEFCTVFEIESTEQDTTADSRIYATNHLKLVNDFQDYLIGFSVGQHAYKVAEDDILVWDKDGSSRVEKLARTSRWAERINRLKLLEKDIASLMKVLRNV